MNKLHRPKYRTADLRVGFFSEIVRAGVGVFLFTRGKHDLSN